MENSAKFALTADDTVAGMRLYAWSGMTSRKSLIRWFLLWVVLVAVLGWIVTRGSLAPEKLPATALVVLGGSLIPFLLAAIVTVIGVPIQARRTHRQQRTLRGDMTLAWSDDALHIESEYGIFDIPWGHFLRWREDGRSILLYESERLVRIIPKRALSDGQQQSLRASLVHIEASRGKSL